MTCGFERGCVYNRRADIHARFGGQQQGGIITPANHALVIIVTGASGLAHGYNDRMRDDGVFEYYGAGQLGDMGMLRGNKAIANHSIDGKSLLLFEMAAKGLRFKGEMVCIGYRREADADRDNNTREAIVFELCPLENVNETVERVADTTPVEDVGNVDPDLVSLRRAALAAATNTPGKMHSIASIIQRSNHVRKYVLARAKGHCESCGARAPFIRSDNTPYLEPHHIHRLSDGGPDHPSHVIALCPNCHRRAHSSHDRSAFKETLTKQMHAIEQRASRKKVV